MDNVFFSYQTLRAYLKQLSDRQCLEVQHVFFRGTEGKERKRKENSIDRLDQYILET